MDAGLQCHISCNLWHRMLFKWFGQSWRNSSTWQQAKMCNWRVQRGPNSIAERQLDHPALSPTCIQAKRESSLYGYASWIRLHDDSQWVVMDDQQRKHENQLWMQVQPPIFVDGDKFERHNEHSWIVGFELMAWPTRSYAPRWTGSADGNRLHPKTLDEDEL